MSGNWGELLPESLFGAKKGRMAFYEAHAEVIDNLFNMDYWRQKMTPEHLEMRRHPNRSIDWIPQEILKERDEVFVAWCGYILSPDEWTANESWTWREEEVCLVCGTDEEQCNARLIAEKNTEHTTWWPSLKNGWCNFCREEMHDKIQQITKDISRMANI